MVWGQIDRVAVDPKVLARARAWGRGLKLYRLLRRATRRRWRGREVRGGLGQRNPPDAAGVTATARAARLRCWFAFQKGSVFRFSAIRTSPGGPDVFARFDSPCLVSHVPARRVGTAWPSEPGRCSGLSQRTGVTSRPSPSESGETRGDGVQGTWWRGSVRVSPGAAHTSLVLLPEQPLTAAASGRRKLWGKNAPLQKREENADRLFKGQLRNASPKREYIVSNLRRSPNC